MKEQRGSFVAVSTGMLLAGHITARCQKIIEEADVIYCLVPHALCETWLKNCNSNVKSLQPYYKKGRNRVQTYEKMVDVMMNDVREGKRVCGAFYGHAGVFSCVPHMAIEQSHKEGFVAYMEPGISAEACLYADLQIDPGNYGVQSIEATQLMLFDHTLNTKGYILLWQIAIAGDHTASKFSSDESKLQCLVNHLYKDIPSDHEVIIYEAKFTPLDEVRKEKVKLMDLPKQELKLHSTLVIPPVQELEYDQAMLRELGITGLEYT
ncbi:SAM-dependent methyltransferase [Kangiella taiwanensis]|uniref:SAM-dependent methyltransferase n=1 Tax=Kangiella taiwanensis TaxID=1079179 RepID=A0ABP8HVX0_9GAMM|nr:SAM-dependent methyltransferase [Kangiella taiwanensis]